MANKKTAKKKTGKKNINPTPDKQIMIIVAVGIALVLGVIVFLAVRGDVNSKNEPSTTATTAVKATMNTQELERRAFYEEHEALFQTVKDIYWLGIYDNYKSVMPPEAWAALAKEEGVTVDELFALIDAENETATLPDEEVTFYISDYTLLTGHDREELIAKFAETYEMDPEMFGEAYTMDVEMVFKKADGTKRSELKTYYSFEVNGVRYLATETGFVG